MTVNACEKIQCIPMERLNWIAAFASGMILDVGSADASVWIHYLKPSVERVVLLDCDIWRHKVKFQFVRGDGHHLPFQDGSFDTVVLGDVLEHCIDPMRMLCEAKRVCRFRVVATVPDEGVWDVKAYGFKYTPGKWREEVDAFKQTFHLDWAVFLDVVDEEKFPHLLHQRIFTLDSLLKLLKQMDMVIFLAHLHHQQTHFGVCLERRRKNGSSCFEAERR